jgi:hypothetical protein
VTSDRNVWQKERGLSNPLAEIDRSGHPEFKMDGEEDTTKYAKGAKREVKLLFQDESDKQCNYSGR